MNLRPIPNPDAACDGRDRVERRYAIRQPRRMPIENPERLWMPRREWDDQENSN